MLSFHAVTENMDSYHVTDGDNDNTIIGTLEFRGEWEYCPWGSGDYFTYKTGDLLQLLTQIDRLNKRHPCIKQPSKEYTKR